MIDSTGSLELPTSCSSWKTFLGTSRGTDSQRVRNVFQETSIIQDSPKHRCGILNKRPPVPHAYLVPVVMVSEPKTTSLNGIWPAMLSWSYLRCCTEAYLTSAMSWPYEWERSSATGSLGKLCDLPPLRSASLVLEDEAPLHSPFYLGKWEWIRKKTGKAITLTDGGSKKYLMSRETL